jgi:hypothetical protein
MKYVLLYEAADDFRVQVLFTSKRIARCGRSFIRQGSS